MQHTPPKNLLTRRSQRGVSQRGVSQRGVSQRGVSQRGVSQRGVSQAGFTLVEVLIATALLGFSLVVMFGFHAQAVRSNQYARKITDCSYLSQAQMEELIALPWSANTGLPTDLELATAGAGTWDPLYHPSSGGWPTAVNAAGEQFGSESNYMPAARYFVTWEAEDTDGTETMIRLRVRCVWEDGDFNTWHGTTIASYRFVDGSIANTSSSSSSGGGGT